MQCNVEDLNNCSQEELRKIVFNEGTDIKIRIEAIDYICDAFFLKEIYDNQSNIDLRNASRSKLESMFSTNGEIVNYLCDLIDVDDEILVNIALTDSDYFPGAGWSIAGTKPAVKYGYPIRCMALSKIKKEDSFVKFAKEINTEIEFPELDDDEPEQDPQFGGMTLNMVKYGKYIREARECDLEVLCRYAIKNISNEEALCDIALNAKFWISRILAVEKMSDRKILEHVSKNDFYEEVRLAAGKRLDEVKK